MSNIFKKIKRWYRSGAMAKGRKSVASLYGAEEEDQIDFSYDNPWLSIKDTGE